MPPAPRVSPEDRAVETVAQLLALGVEPSRIEVDGNRVLIEVRATRKEQADRAVADLPRPGTPAWYSAQARRNTGGSK